MNTELQKVEGALTAFERIEAGLANLRDRFSGVVYPVDTKAGLGEALAARKEIRDPRLATEKIRKDAKAPILDLGRQLDAKAKYITEKLMELEGPIDAQIQAETARKEAAIHAENMRVIGIKEAIHNLELVPAQMSGKSAADIAKRAEALQAYDLTEWAAEFIVDAEKARGQALNALQQLHAGAAAQEATAAAEAAKIAQERAELAKLRAEQEERAKAEKERLDREAAARAFEESQARARIAEAERESRERLEAESARIAAERAESDRQERLARRGREEAERVRQQAIREAEEAVAAQKREIQRQQEELMDAEAMLDTFKTRFGHLRQFAGVVKAIDALQKKAA